MKYMIDESRGWFRQGDVAFIPLVDTPELRAMIQGGKQRPDGAVAYGEVTGHAHRVDCRGGDAVVMEVGEDVLVDVLRPEGVLVIHEDHDPEGEGFKNSTGVAEPLPSGLFIARPQRELSLDQIRPVSD